MSVSELFVTNLTRYSPGVYSTAARIIVGSWAQVAYETDVLLSDLECLDQPSTAMLAAQKFYATSLS